MSSVVMSMCLLATFMCSSTLSTGCLLHQLYCLIDRHHAAHARKHPRHEELVVVAAGRIAGIAHDHDPQIQVACGEDGGGDAHVGRAAGDHDGVEAAHAKLQ